MKSHCVKALFSLVFAIALLVMGCNSDDPTAPRRGGTGLGDPFPWMKNTAGTYGSFYISARTMAGRSTATTTYRSGGGIFSDSNHRSPVNGGQITAGDLTVNYNSDYGYLSLGQPAFGAVSTWALAGNTANGTPAFSDSMYVPAVIVMSHPSTPGTALSKSSGFTIQWNADPNNETVVVGFRYDEIISNFVDTSLSDNPYGWLRFAPDNGSYTIPTSALDSVPAGGYIDVIVARGASRLSGTSARKYHIYGTTIANGMFKVAN